MTTVGHASPFAEVNELGARVKAGFQAYHVKFPCIVNTKKIGAGEQVILKWSNEKKRKDGVGTSVTEFEKLEVRDKRKKRKVGTGEQLILKWSNEKKRKYAEAKSVIAFENLDVRDNRKKRCRGWSTNSGNGGGN